MNKTELIQLIKECMFESKSGIYEMTLPPGFTSDDFESIDSFSTITETENDKLLGAPITDFPPDEMASYLQRVADKKKDVTDKYKYPFVHRSNIIDDNGKVIDQEKLKSLIAVRPEKLLKQNTKIQHSGGQSYTFYDISLPALRGLIVDESTNQFKIVTTCPAAGACKIYCYAKRGGFVQWKAASLSQTRMVNFLLNDYLGFKVKLISELNSAVARNAKKNVKVVLRWMDSGDFMSEKYLMLAFDVARSTPNIIHYGYTKQVGMVSAAIKPSNFVFNFSMGAIKPEEDKIKKSDKQSIVVPKQVFKDLIVKDENGNWKPNNPEDLDTLKRKLSLKYNVSEDTIITYNDLQEIPYNPDNIVDAKYSVIVGPGNGDDAAMRKDVQIVFLLIH